MKDKKLACFFITGELLLEFLKEKTDLPEDTKLILVAENMNNPIKDKKVKEIMNKKYPEGNENIITFIVTSKEFLKILDDNAIPMIDLKTK